MYTLCVHFSGIQVLVVWRLWPMQSDFVQDPDEVPPLIQKASSDVKTDWQVLFSPFCPGILGAVDPPWGVNVGWDVCLLVSFTPLRPCLLVSSPLNAGGQLSLVLMLFTCVQVWTLNTAVHWRHNSAQLVFLCFVLGMNQLSLVGLNWCHILGGDVASLLFLTGWCAQFGSVFLFMGGNVLWCPDDPSTCLCVEPVLLGLVKASTSWVLMLTQVSSTYLNH